MTANIKNPTLGFKSSTEVDYVIRGGVGGGVGEGGGGKAARAEEDKKYVPSPHPGQKSVSCFLRHKQ